MEKIIYFKTICFLSIICAVHGINELEEDYANNNEKYKIEGKILRPESSSISDPDWFGNIKVFTNSGHVGFVRQDGSFVINNVPWGSHVIQVLNPSYFFESARVDINSKGKIRARAINHIQPSKVELMVYPLRLKSLSPMKYFQQREQLKLTDIIFHHYVIMTIIPVAFLMILHRLGDPETRKEMEQFQMPNRDMPELSEMVTNFLGGNSSSSSSAGSNQASIHQSKSKIRPYKRKEK